VTLCDLLTLSTAAAAAAIIAQVVTDLARATGLAESVEGDGKRLNRVLQLTVFSNTVSPADVVCCNYRRVGSRRL
jgi:hypothetical protein